jgi:phosphomannomutase
LKVNFFRINLLSGFGQVGRHLIRYSGTENKLRILVEHQDAAEVHRWSKAFQTAVAADLESL